MKVHKILTLTLLCSLFSVVGYSQSILFSVISTFGTSFKNDNFNISYTVGEPIVYAYDGDEFSLNAGYEQAFSTIVVDEFEENWSAILYPNPAKDYFYLEFKSKNEYRFKATLIDMAGRLIQIDDNLDDENVFKTQSEKMYFRIPVNTEQGIYILNIRNLDTKTNKNIKFFIKN